MPEAAIPKPVNESELLDTLMSLRLGTMGVEIPTLPDRPSPTARTSLRVLLAEDSLYNQKLAVALLTKRGHQVTIANNGREAVDLLFRQPFDRVLMDVQMPEMDGLEATRVIREREARVGLHRPIIAMTAQALTGDRERCLAVGMDEYLTKPIRSDQLFETLEANFPNAVFPKGEAARKPPRARPHSARHDDPQLIEGSAIGRDAERENSVPATGAAPQGPDGCDRIRVESAVSDAVTPARQNGEVPHSAFVNWTQALSAVGGDDQLLKEVVGACLEDFPRWLHDFEQGLARNEPALFRRAAHSVR